MKQSLQKPTPKAKATEGETTTDVVQQDAPAEVIGEATPGTPPGAGRAYEEGAPGTANPNGKASATLAGGNPVTSPVIGNPGEARPESGYDYGLAAARSNFQPPTNPRAATQPVSSVPMLVQVRQEPQEPDDTEYAERVRARVKGHYEGLREPGDVFDNTQNLPTYPEDPNSWFEDATKPSAEAMTPRDMLRARKAKAVAKK